MLGLEGFGWIRGWGGVESWGCREVEVWRKCEESWGYLDWEMLEWMCEESLLKNVNDVIVVRIFKYILNSINGKIINLP